MRTAIVTALMANAFLIAACDGDEITPIDQDQRIDRAFGLAYDLRGRPAAGVKVNFEPQGIEVITNARGLFEVEGLAIGSTKVVVQFTPPTERCLELSKVAAADLGDLYQGMASGCGRPTACAGDKDCDGLSDRQELEGWTVGVVQADRGLADHPVVSDPGLYDSDLDGLSDAEEYAALLDPARRDTDGDLLGDYAELMIFHSSGAMVDTDGDACPLLNDTSDEFCLTDPDLWDGFEVTLSRTSPTLVDTDGDGMTDYQEINVGGTNPRVADLPTLDLRLYGNPLIELDIDVETGEAAKSQTLERNEEEQVDTDTVSTKMSIENTVTLHTEAEAGTSNWPPSFNAKLTTDTKFQHGYFHDTSSSWKNTSVQSSQQNYETWERTNVSFDDGRLSVAMKVVNRSDLSFALDDLRVVAFRLEGGGQFSLIGTMQPDQAWVGTEHILGPGGEITLTASLEHIDGGMMRALVRNPTAMMFEVGAYSLFQLDDQGVERTTNYAKLGEAVVQRTGLVVVDFGDGRVRRHLVATNVYRGPDGAGLGIPLTEVLADLGIDWETTVSTSSLGVEGPRVLARVDDVSSYDVCRDPEQTVVDCAQVQPRGYWLLAGSGEAFGGSKPVQLEDLVLGRGDRIHLVYNKDSDGDGIFDREECLLGTNRDLPDTDGDELSDYEESKLGWQVAVQGRAPYTVYSDPRFADIDGDFLSDHTEMFVGTDPYLKNTDGDLDSDTVDPDPLAPPCLSGAAIGLTAWWDGSYQYLGANGYWAKDVWVGEVDATASDGQLLSDAPEAMLNQIAGDRVLQMNQEATDRHERVEVPSHSSLNPQHEFTVSAWIYWQGIGAGADWATILAKGPVGTENYKLSISKAGVLRLTVQRNAHDKCWHCSFGSDSLCVDWSCEDTDYDETLSLDSSTSIPTQAWVHVAATFGGETMRLYVDSALAGQAVVTPVWWSGWNRHLRTTNRLITNERPLRIGLEDATEPTAPFRGLVDDVQVSLRSLRADQIALLYQLGVCAP